MDFNRLCKDERRRLSSRLEKWQHILDSTTKKITLSSDARGDIMAVVGQTQMFLNKGMRKFEQVLAEAFHETEDMPQIKLSDLEGYWAKVMIDINAIHSRFDELEDLDLVGSANLREAENSQEWR